MPGAFAATPVASAEGFRPVIVLRRGVMESGIGFPS
jgi:hypothetical protein